MVAPSNDNVWGVTKSSSDDSSPWTVNLYDSEDNQISVAHRKKGLQFSVNNNVLVMALEDDSYAIILNLSVT